VCGVNVVALVVVMAIDRRRMNDDIEFIIFCNRVYLHFYSLFFTTAIYVLFGLYYFKCIHCNGGRLLLIPSSLDEQATLSKAHKVIQRFFFSFFGLV